MIQAPAAEEYSFTQAIDYYMCLDPETPPQHVMPDEAPLTEEERKIKPWRRLMGDRARRVRKALQLHLSRDWDRNHHFPPTDTVFPAFTPPSPDTKG